MAAIHHSYRPLFGRAAHNTLTVGRIRSSFRAATNLPMPVSRLNQANSLWTGYHLTEDLLEISLQVLVVLDAARPMRS